MLRPCLVRVVSDDDPVFIRVNKLLNGCRTRLSNDKFFFKDLDVACEECGVLSPDRAQSIVHETTCHRHTCVHCSSAFVNNHLLLVHEAQHNNYFSSHVCFIFECMLCFR
ncbi:hypothetical protein EG68_11760 [Paragonimus skrjabini miyazakii]|uniref:C2H2-type domain-containing protein n=1 Tax=Paragonimus skrjabini miyazakii TaxID=59628 RepID=A0A8S9YDX7_9TREM|nr:hypothetical protein EG68_11760 [Paragonimus skrjabini miyazakii]